MPEPVPESFDILIVGAGHAGAQAAIALRQHGFAGRIALLGDEPELPYERPPLSKDYLSGDRPFERLLLRPPAFWRDRDVRLMPGRSVVRVDPAAHLAGLGDGGSIRYGTLIYATGGAPRRLTCTGHDLRGVHTIRNRADVDRLVAELPHVERIVVIGGGYIGLEAAAVLTGLGKRVTLLEAQDRVLARVAGPHVSHFYQAEHRARGVDLRTDARVACIEERDGAAVGVRLDDGTLLPCRMVVVGIGIVPAVGPLIAAGAAGGDGVRVDAFCRTTLPDIYAIGDCAAHANSYAGGAVVRVESVQNAVDQAATAAKAIVGDPAPHDAVPWFWSNQYDLKLQTVGLSNGFDRTVVRGDIASRGFSVVYLRRGAVIALDCVNATRDYVQGRALVVGRVACSPDALADPDTPLKSLATGTR